MTKDKNEDNFNEQLKKTAKKTQATETADFYRLPAELKKEYENWSPFQRKYAEFRARGLSMAKAAELAGSTAATSDARSRVGYQIERLPKMKEYIGFIQAARARSATVDEAEIVHKLRAVFQQALDTNKLSDANKSLELLGNMLGLFDKETRVTKKQQDSVTNAKATKNNVKAFKDEEDMDDNSSKTRINKIESLLKIIDKDKK